MRFCFLLLSFFTAVACAADPADAFRDWSAFGRLDLEKLASGKVAKECNASMKFPRGLTAQAVYVVAAPPDAAVRLLIYSDPTKHAESETYQHRVFQDGADAQFATLSLDPKVASVRRLLAAMPTGVGLQLSAEEAGKLPRAGSRTAAESFWAGLLRERWSQLASRGNWGRVRGYETRRELLSLLAEESRIARHFSSLLAPVVSENLPSPPAASYWDVSGVNGTAAVALGVLYLRTEEARRQVLDVTYYSSGSYLTSLTLYELIPVTLGGRSHTLVWQGCLVSAPALAGGFGVKRKIASVMTLNELEQSVKLFQQDAAAARPNGRGELAQ